VLLADRLSGSASSAFRDAFGVGIVEWRILAHVAAQRWSRRNASAGSAASTRAA